MKKKVLIIGSGLELNSVAEKLRLDKTEIEVVDDIDEASKLLKGEYSKEATYAYKRLPELHEHPFAGDLTKKQLNAPAMEPVRNTPKIQNNEPCPCGSGKKYKKCCK